MAAPVSAPVALGRFVWLELATTDPNAAIEFYTKVVGWTTTPWAGRMPYTMFNGTRGPVGGVMAITPDMKARGVPPNWIAYVSTPDVDATLKQVTALGGRVLVPGTDIPNVGRFGVFKDPQGAALALLAPQGDNPPREGQPQNGEVCWYELATTDASAAFDFYRTVFEWEKKDSMEMGPGNIIECTASVRRPSVACTRAIPSKARPCGSPTSRSRTSRTRRRASPQVGGKILNGRNGCARRPHRDGGGSAGSILRASYGQAPVARAFPGAPQREGQWRTIAAGPFDAPDVDVRLPRGCLPQCANDSQHDFRQAVGVDVVHLPEHNDPHLGSWIEHDRGARSLLAAAVSDVVRARSSIDPQPSPYPVVAPLEVCCDVRPVCEYAGRSNAS